MSEITTADFRMLRPVAVTDARHTSTNVPEAVVPTYSGATTYALGEWAGPAPVYGEPQTVYKSLQAGNIGHAQSDTDWWKVVGVVYPPFNIASSSALGGIVSSISADVHLLYKSQIAANTGNDLSDSTKWLLLGSTNARAMFDETYGSQTTNADSVETTLTMGALTTAVFVGNLQGTQVTLEQSVSGWSQTKKLNSHLVDNWYDFFFEDIVTLSNVVFTGVPPRAASTLTLTIDNPGSTAACGIVLLGKPAHIGTTQWELVASWVTYSGTTVDGFGNPTFARHGVVSRLNLEVDILPNYESEAARILQEHVDVPTAFIASTEHALGLLYGALGPGSVPLSRSGKKASLEIIGLDLK